MTVHLFWCSYIATNPFHYKEIGNNTIGQWLKNNVCQSAILCQASVIMVWLVSSFPKSG